MIADPPVDEGGVQVTVSWLSPGISAGGPLAPGIVAGITTVDAIEGVLVPAMFDAATETV